MARASSSRSPTRAPLLPPLRLGRSRLLAGALASALITVGIEAEVWTVAPLSDTAPLPSSTAPATTVALDAGAAAAPAPGTSSDARPAERLGPPDTFQWFGGRLVRAVETRRMLVTAYSPDERSCAPFADNVTASGYSVWTNGMRLVAADPAIPFGTLVSVPGYAGGAVVPVLDRGGRIKGQRLDVLYETHRRARRWGAQRLDVTFWEYFE